MSDKLGPVSYKMSDEDPFLGREMHKSRQFSEHTMEVIDAEVHQVLDKAAKDADALLIKYREQLEILTKSLLKEEELDRHEITALIGPSLHQQRKESNAKRIVKYSEKAASNGSASNGSASGGTEVEDESVSESENS